MTKNKLPQGNNEAVNSDRNLERTWATFCHLSALAALIGIPFGNILGPLTIWLIKKNEMPLVDDEGKSAVNFQISMTIYTIVVGLLFFVGIGFLLIFPIILANVIFVIIASVRISNSKQFLYPCTIQFIK